MTVTHGPIVVRKRLGHALKQLRMARNLQLAPVAKQMEISPSKLSRIETGQVEPKFRDIRDLLTIYKASPAESERILEWAGEAKSPAWWQPLATNVAGGNLDQLLSLEMEARRKRTFAMPMAGLLQTEAYARSLLGSGQLDLPRAEIDRIVEVRMRRQNVINLDRTDAPPLELHVVLDEVALHRVTDPTIMRDQIALLLRRSAQSNVKLQILPFSAGWTRAVSTFSIFDPRDPTTDWPVINVESTERDSYYDTAADVAEYENVWKNVLPSALDVDATRQRLLDHLEA